MLEGSVGIEEKGGGDTKNQIKCKFLKEVMCKRKVNIATEPLKGHG